LIAWEKKDENELKGVVKCTCNRKMLLVLLYAFKRRWIEEKVQCARTLLEYTTRVNTNNQPNNKALLFFTQNLQKVKTVAIELWESFLQGQSYKAYKYMHVKQF
jgi:hypothetical protein